MSFRDQWSLLVDEVVGMNSTDHLPREYSPMDFLPAGRNIPAELLEYIRSGSAAFETESRALFHSQMTPEEGFHAKPSVAVTAQGSLSFAAARNSGDADPVGVGGGGSSKSAEAGKSHGAETDGPNFFEAYRTHMVPAKRGRMELAPPVAPPRSLGSAARLASGFLLPEYYAQKHRQPDFIPIIIVPANISSLLQLFNVRDFLERGVYIDPPTLFVNAETGAVNVQDSKPDAVIVTPGSFLDPDKYTVAYKLFRVVDDPKQVKNWQHVCACVVDGNEWQFKGWFPNEPTPLPISELFQRVCGFLPYMEEDKLPKAIQQWHVKPLPLTRRVVKAHAHILQASVFWEHLYTFLETHPFFKLYTVPLD